VQCGAHTDVFKETCAIRGVHTHTASHDGCAAASSAAALSAASDVPAQQRMGQGVLRCPVDSRRRHTQQLHLLPVLAGQGELG
jgi:cysteine synthase